MELLQVLEDEGNSLVELAREADLTRPVPGCPGWTAGALLRHVTRVYRMAGLTVAERRPVSPGRADLAVDGSDPVQALADEHARLLKALREAADDLDCWAVLPGPNPRETWIRRQAHETVVHRVDLQNAVSGTPLGCAEVDPEVAADGIDEMVMVFAPYFYRHRMRSAVPCTISLRATDVDLRWWIRLSEAEPEFGRGEAVATTEVAGRGGELLLLLWNRRGWDGLTVRGAEDPLRIWQSDTPF